MARKVANKGAKMSPYQKYGKREYDYTSVYRRHPNLRHWKHNPITQGFAVGVTR